MIENGNTVLGFLPATGEDEWSEKCMELEEKSPGYWFTESDQIHAQCIARTRSQVYVRAKQISLVQQL